MDFGCRQNSRSLILELVLFSSFLALLVLVFLSALLYELYSWYMCTGLHTPRNFWYTLLQTTAQQQILSADIWELKWHHAFRQIRKELAALASRHLFSQHYDFDWSFLIFCLDLCDSQCILWSKTIVEDPMKQCWQLLSTNEECSKVTGLQRTVNLYNIIQKKNIRGT